MSSLFVIQGRDQGKRFNLDRAYTSIGRDTINHIRLNDGETSRQHAEIRNVELGEGFYLTDLGSSNGTYVNGERVQRHVLQSGDRIQLGSSLLIFTGPDVSKDADAIADDVEFVTALEQESQIVSSLPHDENSQFFYGDAVHGESPWLARARSNLQVMYRTALAVSHTLDIDELLNRIMELIFEWVEADRGVILLKDRNSGDLQPRARKNRGVKKPPADEKLTISTTILDYVLNNSEGVLTSDASQDDRFDEAGSIVKMGVREAIGVPMQGRYGVVGVIYIDTYTPPGDWTGGGSKKFSDEHLKMMIAIAHQAALAVEDTAYYSAMLQSERLAAIGQTIAGLSHGVKNILQGIRGGSYLIEEGLKKTENPLVRKGWSIVEKNQEKISRLVLDMLTFSKERTPEMEDADLHQITTEVVELMEARAATCGVQIDYAPCEAIPILRFDAEGIHHALLNVVTNAVDACDAGYRKRQLRCDEPEWNDASPSPLPKTTTNATGSETESQTSQPDLDSPDPPEHSQAQQAPGPDAQSVEALARSGRPPDANGPASDRDLPTSPSSDTESTTPIQPPALSANLDDSLAPQDDDANDATNDAQDPSATSCVSSPSSAAAQDAAENGLFDDQAPPQPGSRGQVHISTHYRPDARCVEICVTDNGEGIAQEQLNQIFGVFHSTKGNRGTGLGLSVSQKILHEHGGDIHVVSTLGEGSSFTLVLPAMLATAHDEVPNTWSAQEAQDGQANPPSTLNDGPMPA